LFTFPPFLTHLLSKPAYILAGPFFAASGWISDHARRKCLGGQRFTLFATSTVMAEAPLVSDPAVTKSNVQK
jgi:hypothetical protein